MARFIFTAATYIFHPLFTPLLAALACFVVGPYRTTSPGLEELVLPLMVLTLVLPLLAFALLFQIGVISSPISATLNERIYPLLIHVVLLSILVYQMLPTQEYRTLIYFFVGLIGSSLAALVLIPLQFKISLHMTSLGSIWMYLIALGIHYEQNITLTIALWSVICGLVGTARLYLRAHTRWEVTTGMLLGVFSQLFTLKYWL